MSKLGNKEVILILVIINFLCYYLLFMVGINPIKTKISEQKETIVSLQNEYEEKKQIVDSIPELEATIEQKEAEKAEKFEKGFPNTDAENLHAFMKDELGKSNVTIQNISITQTPRLVTDNGGERETGIYDNKITITANGGYQGITDFIEKVEKLDKSSLLTSLTLTGTSTEMESTFTYSFLTADKTNSKEPDTVFDHQFRQPVSNPALF